MDKYMRIRRLIIFVNLGYDIWMAIQPNIGIYSKYLYILLLYYVEL